MKRTLSFYSLILLLNHSLQSQYQQVDSAQTLTVKKFNYKSLFTPTALITYGIIGIESDDLQLFNSEIKEEINEHIDQN